MKHKKQEPEQRREIPPKSAPEVPKADRERAENGVVVARERDR